MSSSAPGSHRRNADVEDALRAGLDIGQQRGDGGSGRHGETVSLSSDFGRSVSQAVSGADAAPAAFAVQPRAHRKAAAGGEAPRLPEATPLSQELLSRHSASLDDAGALNGGQQLMGSGGVLEQLQKDLEALQLPEEVSVGLFDEDEAADAFVDSGEEFHSPEQQLRSSPPKSAR